MALPTDHATPLHKSNLFSVYADGEVPYMAPFYPSFLQELGRMIRSERGVYWTLRLVMKNTCHLSRQLALRQLRYFVSSITSGIYRMRCIKNVEDVKKGIVEEIEAII